MKSERTAVLRRAAISASLALMMGMLVAPAQATTTPLPAWGVEVYGADEFGNDIAGRALYIRVPEDPTTQVDHVYIFCAVHIPSEFESMTGDHERPPAAALGINQSIPNDPRASDGCYLTLAGVPVFNAPGIGVPGEAATTSSLLNKGNKFYRFDSSVQTGALLVCVNARGLFTSGGLAEAGGCGAFQMEL